VIKAIAFRCYTELGNWVPLIARGTIVTAFCPRRSQYKCQSRRKQDTKSHYKRAPASSEIVKLIRKLRWARLEEKAEQLEKELDRHTVTDTVVSIQNETD
jgi:hypothetical protein